MNSFINWLENKLGKYAIARLPLVMIICYAVGYIMQLINPDIIYSISLNPYAILRGQVWRLVTWVLIPPSTGNLFFLLIALYFYYSIGMNLVNTWGKFYFNYYIFSGMFFTIVASFLILGYFALFHPGTLGDNTTAVLGYNSLFAQLSVYFFSTYYINMSIFLAFAATYPDAQVYLFFILPIKVKILGFIYVGLMVYDALSIWLSGGSLLLSLIELTVIVTSLLNFIIFFISTRKGMRRTPKQMKTARQFKKKTTMAMPAGIAKHKCAICGRTSESHPELEFRFCSKCEGNYEYCQDHLFSHTHMFREK